jgi:GT2 family glycosyltransferase
MPSAAVDFDCSVVIPAFNAAATITGAVHSVLAQRLPCREVIVVDDGSTDATREIAQKIDSDRVRVLAQSNGGPSAAKNAGIRASGGRYVAFLDSDDLWLPTYLEAISVALQRDPRAGLAYTDAYVFDGATLRVRRQTAMHAPDPPPADRLAFLSALLERNFVFTSATVPAGVLAQVGGYPESRTMSEEYELWLRILIAGYGATYAPGPHALYRHHAGQLSSHEVGMSRALADVFQALSVDSLPTAQLRQQLLARRARAEREARIVGGHAGPASQARRLRRRLGVVRKRLGLTHGWYAEPPAAVAATLLGLAPSTQMRPDLAGRGQAQRAPEDRR